MAVSAEKPAPDPRTVRALVLLTAVAGMIDAVAFLGLEQVFCANMTGNVVLLGLGIADAPGLSIGGPAVALAAFLLGAGLTGRIERRGRSRRHYVRQMVKIELLVVAVAALIAIGFDPADELRRMLIIAILASLMGARNETIRRIDLPELRTTVMTLAIAGFAAHEAEGARHDWGDRLRFIGIAAMVAGAVVSALVVLDTDVIWALVAIAAVEVITLAVLGRTATAPDATV